MNRVPVGWHLADEWFADFIRECETNPIKRRRVLRSNRKPIPVKETLARAYADKTEQLCRYLAHEREQKAA